MYFFVTLFNEYFLSDKKLKFDEWETTDEEATEDVHPLESANELVFEAIFDVLRRQQIENSTRPTSGPSSSAIPSTNQMDARASAREFIRVGHLPPPVILEEDENVDQVVEVDNSYDGDDEEMVSTDVPADDVGYDTVH